MINYNEIRVHNIDQLEVYIETLNIDYLYSWILFIA